MEKWEKTEEGEFSARAILGHQNMTTVTTYCLHKMGISAKGENDETRSNSSK